MRVIASRIEKNPVVIVRERLDNTLREQISKKNRALFKLYTLGVLPNPVYFSTKSVGKYLLQEYPEVHKFYENWSNGALKFTSERVALSLINNEDEEYADFANTLKDYLDSEDNIRQLGNIYKKFTKKSLVSMPFQQRPAVSQTRVSMRCGVDFGNKVMSDLCDFGDGNTIYEFNMARYILYAMAEHLGVDELEYRTRASEDKSFFIEDISFKEECKLIDLIVSGGYNCQGKWGKLLIDDYKQYYYSNYTDDNNRVGFDSYEDVLYKDFFDKREQLISDLFKYEKRGWTPVYANNYCIYYIGKNTLQSSKLHDMNSKIDVGFYIYDAGNNCLLDEINLINGVSGEFIGSDVVHRNKYKTYCKPIKLYCAGKLKDYYEISYVRRVEEIDGEKYEYELDPFVGKRTQFEYIDDTELFKKYSVNSKVELLQVLSSNCITMLGISSVEQKLREMIAEYSLAYLYAQCGYTDYNSVLTNHKSLSDEELRGITQQSAKLVHLLG